MEVEAHIVVINGTRYVTAQECERLLSEADERRRVEMQAQIESLNSRLREANAEIKALLDFDPGEM